MRTDIPANSPTSVGCDIGRSVVSFLPEVATCGVFGLEKSISEASTLYPSNRAYRTASCCGRNQFFRNPSENGFLCSLKHGKVFAALLDTFRVIPENLALRGGIAPPKSGDSKEMKRV